MITNFNDHTKGLPKPIKARGKALRQSDDELDAATSPEALRAIMDESNADWKKNVPRDFKNILEAK